MRRTKLLTLTLALGLSACGSPGADRGRADTQARTDRAETEVEVIPPDEEQAGNTAGGEATSSVVVSMEPTEGSDARGTVRFVQQEENVLVRVDLTGFEPGTVHGFHVHEVGDCSAPDASSAGDHYNPLGVPHGLPNGGPRHAGDMGNIEADEAGEVHTERSFDTFSLGRADPPSILGRSVIVHAEPDDGSQPTGAAGARLACGVIEPGRE